MLEAIFTEHEKKEKKVEYLELIYDLIFVYIIGRNNSLLHHIENGFVEPKLFLAYLLCTLAVIQIWTFSAYYINLYGRNSVRDHVFLFVNMFLLYFVAEGTRVHWQTYHTQYHAAWALILANVGLQYLIELRHHKGEPAHVRRISRMVGILFGEAVIVALSIPVYNVTGSTLLTPIAILFGISSVFLAGRKSSAGLVDFPHLSERAMLYVVFTFGEMIIAIAGYFEGEINVSSLYFSGMAFLIVVGLFLSYGMLYDHIIDREMQTNGLGYILIHIFIIFSLNNITTALEFMRDEEVRLLPKVLFLMGSFVMYYVFLFLTSRYAKRRCRFRARLMLKVGGISVGFLLLMLLFRNHIMINIAVTVIYVFAVFAILYRYGKKMDTVESNVSECVTEGES